MTLIVNVDKLLPCVYMRKAKDSIFWNQHWIDHAIKNKIFKQILAFPYGF